MWKEMLVAAGIGLAGVLSYDLGKYMDRQGRAAELSAIAKLDPAAQIKAFDYYHK